jgi:hypothetical protein
MSLTQYVADPDEDHPPQPCPRSVPWCTQGHRDDEDGCRSAAAVIDGWSVDVTVDGGLAGVWLSDPSGLTEANAEPPLTPLHAVLLGLALIWHGVRGWRASHRRPQPAHTTRRSHSATPEAVTR